MFYNLEGIISEIDMNQVVIECSGVGFLVFVSANTLSFLKQGSKQKLYITESIGENNFDLYGFHSKSEKKFFDMLISVSGVGPKAAISILSSSTPESLTAAIINNDEKFLCMAQGIGKKTAQRIILELKDKIAKMDLPSVVSEISSPAGNTDRKTLNDAASALAVLGFSNSEIRQVLNTIDPNGLSTEQIIKQALRLLNN
ncbi:MAG: Holliday junction branch migration protein RuvA [Oscillospiraceae bacterium]|nr:Holliday junction branch migration protein RuvA [Oscillospiraceae bacterium]